MKCFPPFTIALVANTSWSVYNFRAGLIKRLLAENAKVIIIAPVDAYSERLKQWGCIFEPVHLSRYGANPMNDMQFCLELNKIFRRHAIDFIISYTIKPNIFANLVARWRRIPSIAVVTGLGYLFTLPSWKTQLAKWLYKMALRPVSQVWFLNKEDLHFFIQKRIVRNQQAYYLPSEGVDTAYFKTTRSEVKQLYSNPPTFTFLFAGRLLTEKGIREFVEAARILKPLYPQVQFEVLGFLEKDFPHAVTAKEIAQWQKEGIIHYLGSTDAIKNHLQRVDCVVLPSYYREGVPRILLEAASMQLPIITTNNVGCKDIVINNYNGYLCNKQDVQDLSARLEQMLLLPASERTQMGIRSRDLVTRSFREEQIINCYLNVLRQYFQLQPASPEEEVIRSYAKLKKIVPWYYQL